MLPLKERSVRGSTQSVATSKFKVYSEKCKVNGRGRDNVDTNSSRTSTLLQKSSLLPKNTTFKEKDLVTDSKKTRVSQDPFGKTKIGRTALADVSNIQQNSSRLQKPGGSRNSASFASLRSTASSSRPPVGKVKVLATGGTVSHNNVKANTNRTRTSSNFQRVEANETHNMMRKSFPVVKKPRQLGSSDLQSEGDIRSAGKSTRKSGFPVKTRVAGVSNLKTRVSKERASDVFIGLTQRNQTRTEAPQGFQISIQPIPRTTLQSSNAQRNSKSKSICSLGKSSRATSGKRVKVATSAVSKTVKSKAAQKVVVHGANSSKRGDDFKPLMLDTTSSKKSTRRKSYSSLLISRPQYIRAAKEEKLPNIDDKGNPLEVAEYVDDIYQYYWIEEAQSKPLENYMNIHTYITPQMRSILINWLVEVHLKFDLMAETLYLAVALLDRYLSLVSISKSELQLVGLTSLLLASKYEDFWHPRVKDLISISAESYTRKQILEMEKDILKKLRFRLNLPTAYVFMLRFLKASQSEKKLGHLAFYLIELCLIDYEALKFRPSLLCASAVYLARCTLKKSPAWTPLLEKHAHYNEPQFRECAQKILSIHKAASSSVLTVTHDKYKRPEFGAVANVKPLVRLP
ncbi:hypothetical protein RND81_08G090200 [Saponaria officinalis]|uniref:Cyclin-B3-1 n=1 Tax=Saponaria officinalis TaxID=3572 RepID=A0AAW1J5U2_SAPOF